MISVFLLSFKTGYDSDMIRLAEIGATRGYTQVEIAQVSYLLSLYSQLLAVCLFVCYFTIISLTTIIYLRTVLHIYLVCSFPSSSAQLTIYVFLFSWFNKGSQSV